MLFNDDIVLRMENVSKCYEIYSKPIDRLKQILLGKHSKYYKEFWALRDINFEVHRGECVGVIGKNGAGKSTLLQILVGTLTQTTGNIFVNGRIAALLELGSGFNPEFTGRDNVYMNASILGLTKDEIDITYQEIVDFADIGDFIEQPVKTYSSGMLVRLAFAVQIMVHPDILIVDEALAVGDALFQQKCIHRLKELIKNGTTIFFVSHDIGMVRALCTSAIYLKESTICAKGNAIDITNKYWKDLAITSKGKSHSKKSDSEYSLQIINNELSIKTVIKNRFRSDSKKMTHGGGGEIIFTGFDIYNQNGEIISTCKTNDQITLVISLHATQDIPQGAQLGMVCNDRRGIDIFSANMYAYDVFLPKIAKGENFTVEITFKFPLLPGDYAFSYSIREDYTNLYYYDIMHKVHILNVQPPDWMQKNSGAYLYLSDLHFSTSLT